MSIVIAIQFITLLACVVHCFIPRVKYSVLSFTGLNAIISMYVFSSHLSNPNSHYDSLMPLFFGYDLGISSNSLSITSGFIVTVISAVITCFSYGFFQKYLDRFLCHLHALTLLVLLFASSNNLLQVSVFSILIVVSTYFLIHFDNNVSIKYSDFLMPNLIGDSLVVFTLIAIKYNFKSLAFSEINNVVISSDSLLYKNDIITLLITVGLLIKSSQFLASRWIKTTMKAPLPSTILIHIAIAMNVFMIVWLQNLFEYSVITQFVLIAFGVVTSVWCALKAMHSKSLDKMLTYSTSSQIGFMFMACGFSSYSATIILFATYSFSKLLLFLSVGSVRYALSGESRIENMGGLFELLPKTYIAFLIAVLSLINVPLLPSYYAKKQLIIEIISSNSLMCYIALFAMLIASIFLCICLFRMMYFIFHGNSHIDDVALAYVNEDNRYINVSLYVSMFLAIFSGVIFYYFVLVDIIWKDIFAFAYGNVSSEIMAFSIANIAGIVGSLFIYKSIKQKSFDVHYNLESWRFDNIELLFQNIKKYARRVLNFLANIKVDFRINYKIFFLLFLILLFFKVLRFVC